MINVLTLPKTFNNWLGFERCLWQRQSGSFERVPKTGVFGTTLSGGYADKRKFNVYA
jgi:hypothetical protein